MQSKLSQKPVAISFCFPGPAEYEDGIIGDLKILCDCSVEESVSIRGVRRVYAREAGIKMDNCPSPKVIYEIGMGWKKGDRRAACKAFEEFAIAAGDAFANAIMLIDGLIVIGGGLSWDHPLFLQRLVDEMNTQYTTMLGTSLNRLEVKVFNLENNYELMQFIKGDTREITVPFSDRKIKYDPLKRVGVGIIRLGTANAVAIGAYAFALNQLDRRNT